MIRIFKHLFLFTLFLFLGTTFCQERFEQKVISSEYFNNETEIRYYKDNTLIGFISYTKVPLLKFYAVHSFFIRPQYRNRGYGKRLLLYTCNHLKKIGAKRIYVQPGPFEITNGRARNITDETRDAKIERLLKLYKYTDFTHVANITSACAYILYRMLGIDENPRCLMVR